MFEKILIANRGEIACRIMKTARRLGIKTVAVYSEVDAGALHVSMADEAICIGAAPASESYLNQDKIIDACRQTGAQAVHPGYGFLSERAEFARRLEAEKIAFIGPNPHAIEAMGDKIESKKFANEARVSTVPGYLGVIESPDQAVEIAAGIGYPVMIKASAGGGGKGMRIAWNADEVRDGYVRSKSEAASSFGDDRVFIEKFIENPRHIEIQVLGDKHGNVIHLLERECSIQRRNQKVLEEAPSPLLDEATRQEMGSQAIALSKAVDYDSAGTVEFVVDQQKNFYFLEMNTRLQVEHPVTELVTGVDLVEHMIRVAAGETLSLTQADIKPNGWAIESRVYAEDPKRNFMPSIGRLVRYQPPETLEVGDCTIRNDTGVVEGDEVSLYYDPMLAKLITHGPTRAEAIETMSGALDHFNVEGIETNIQFLSVLMNHDRWKSGELATSFLDDEFPDGFIIDGAEAAKSKVMAAVSFAIEILKRTRLDHLTGRLRPHSGNLRSSWVMSLDGAEIPVEVLGGFPETPSDLELSIGGSEPIHVTSSWSPGQALWLGSVDGENVVVRVHSYAGSCRLQWRGFAANARLMTQRIAELNRLMPDKSDADSGKVLRCPMPGLIVSLEVKEGQSVKAGDTLAVVEAMKMENVLRAERDCVVETISASVGESLAVDSVIMEFQQAE
ncbi:MAG: acetyl/propionyl/methylcrotonyl-CoA carboxylase subunit alpha [Rhodobacteraceae bacterium]|nr:acetyl/propionyl/methylcrotonyl-CoA carboxylase subunit alpha [Paracoccaceae bacterium]